MKEGNTYTKQEIEDFYQTWKETTSTNDYKFGIEPYIFIRFGQYEFQKEDKDWVCTRTPETPVENIGGIIGSKTHTTTRKYWTSHSRIAREARKNQK